MFSCCSVVESELLMYPFCDALSVRCGGSFGDRAVEEGGRGVWRRGAAVGLVGAGGRLADGDGTSRAGARPVRLHHGAWCAGRGGSARLLPAGAGGRASLLHLRRRPPRHQGREPAGGPEDRTDQTHRLRLRGAPQRCRVHRVRWWVWPSNGNTRAASTVYLLCCTGAVVMTTAEKNCQLTGSGRESLLV